MVSILVGEAYQVSTQQQKLVADFLTTNDELAVERLDASTIELSDILTAVTSLPLLCSNKMVILGSLKDRKEIQDAVAEILSAVASEVHLLLIETDLVKGSAYQKTLAAQPGYSEYKPRQLAELKQWLIAHAEELGSKIEPPAVDFLIDQLGENNLILATELSKLSVYPEIDQQLISQLVEPTPKSRIFDLLDAVTRGEQQRALSFYEDQRMQKVEPLQILAMIIWQVQLILLAKRSKRNLAQVAVDAGVGLYPLRKASGIARTISSGQLQELLRSCITTERQIRFDFVNPDSSLKFLIAKACLVRL